MQSSESSAHHTAANPSIALPYRDIKTLSWMTIALSSCRYCLAIWNASAFWKLPVAQYRTPQTLSLAILPVQGGRGVHRLRTTIAVTRSSDHQGNGVQQWLLPRFAPLLCGATCGGEALDPPGLCEQPTPLNQHFYQAVKLVLEENPEKNASLCPWPTW
jgi:hypothetical protein